MIMIQAMPDGMNLMIIVALLILQTSIFQQITLQMEMVFAMAKVMKPNVMMVI